MRAAHLPITQFPRPRRLAGLVAACMLFGAAVPSAWAQLPPSRFLEPHHSSFRPVAGERNPFLPVTADAVPAASEVRGKNGSTGAENPAAHSGGMIGAGLPERYRPASATAREAVPRESVAPYKVSEDSFRLSGILLDSREPLAVINGQSCTIGDKVMLNAGAGILLEFSVAEIKDREVRLTCQEVEVTLRLKGKSGVVE